MKCLKCEKVLTTVYDDPPQLNGAGEMICTFSYGSRFDQCLDMEGRSSLLMPQSDNRSELLTAICDQVRAYICDDCFERHADLFDGYNIEVKRTETKTL